MKIPYGISNFGLIRSVGYFYADKTPFLPVLERAESGCLLVLRPRRFGKSTLLSLLKYYYDINEKDQFDALFKGLWIHEHPTVERNSYLVLTLDFSTVSTDGDGDSLRRKFSASVKGPLRAFLLQYGARIPQLAVMYDELEGYQDAAALMTKLLGIIAGTSYKIYVLIDEYDNFANQLLFGGSEDVYEQVIFKRTGFVPGFYATLKAGMESGAIARMYITGVTPIMLDDLSSRFNIPTDASQDPELNALAGFTRADVLRAVDEFLAARPEIAQLPEIGDRHRLLKVIEQYYDGYRFSEEATERVFNSVMVLYFLCEVYARHKYPDEMLDLNARMNYLHLERIGAPSGTGAAEQRALLEALLSEGHLRSDLVYQAGTNSFSPHAPYISLLYHLGMLTLRRTPRDGMGYDLEIPNRVIRELQWEHLLLMLQEQDHVTIDARPLDAALRAMGVEGEIQPFLDLFHEQVIHRLGVNDTRRFDEKALKPMLVAFIAQSWMFYPLSEKEFAQGYCDLFLGASRSVPQARYSWLLEFKYLPTNAKPAQIEAAFAEALAQVERYASDQTLLPLLLGNRELKAGMIVFVGIKKVLFRPWPPVPSAKPKAARKARPARRRAR